jgi:hypothetical protein
MNLNTVKIRYFCTPRQVGKTTFAKWEALKTEKHLLFAHNLSHAKQLERESNGTLNVVTYSTLDRDLTLNNFDDIEVLILDEYAFASGSQKKNLYVYVIPRMAAKNLKEIYVFTTPKFQISQEMYAYVATMKAQGYSSINYAQIRKDKPHWFLMPHDRYAIQDFFDELLADLAFIQFDKTNLGTFKLEFRDGNQRLPMYNYKSRDGKREEFEAMGLSDSEITGQFIIK